MRKLFQKFSKALQAGSRTACNNLKVPLSHQTNQAIRFAFSDGGKYSKQTMDNLMKQAQSFYESEVKDTMNRSIIDLQQQEEWQTQVLDSQIPVVLDCYADWCQPCKKLTPILEEKANHSQGKWKLVKLNIDKFPQLSTALQIQSIPTVFLISNKNAVDGFVGSPSEEELKIFFNTVQNISGLSPQEDVTKQSIAKANSLIENNSNLKEASEIINKLLQNEVTKNKHGGILNGMLALISAKQGNKQEALKLINEIKTKFSDEAKEEEVAKLVQSVEDILKELQRKAQNDPEIDRLKEEAKNNPQDLSRLFALSKYQTEKNLHEDAIDNLFIVRSFLASIQCYLFFLVLLKIIKTDRNWENKKANKLLIDIFSQIGTSHPLTISGRKKLQKLLF